MLHQRLSELKFIPSAAVLRSTDQSLLRFDAAGVVRGIVYHLIDEKLTKAISTDTIRETLDRLSAKEFNPSISRGRWKGMSNSQRLEWLLAESQTITLVGEDEVVYLRTRRTR